MDALTSVPSATRQTHKHVGDERCPWCDQPIPHERFEEIRKRIATREREAFARERAEGEAKLKGAIEKRIAVAVAAARKEVEGVSAKKLAEMERAKKTLEQEAQKAKAAQEKEINRRVREEKKVLEKGKTEAVNAEKTRAHNERLRLESRLQDLQRQLQKKTAEELGDNAEIDLFEVLKAEFQGDRLRRIPKGAAGVDIIHEIVHKGMRCGLIVYDSKNRTSWRNEYATKLREDQLREKADHAILSTSVFPAGFQQLHIRDGVVITHPARVVALATLLRSHMLRVHSLRMSSETRHERTLALYAFITSERCTQLLDHIDEMADEMIDLDQKELKAHDATWKRRGDLIRTVQRARNELVSEIDRIVGLTVGTQP